MLGLIGRMRIAILLDKAFQAAAHTRYEEALAHLEAAEAAGLSKQRPWTKVSAQARLLRAFLEIELHKYEEALRRLIDLQKFFLSRQNQTAEMKYLECYASVLAGTPLRSPELEFSDLAMCGFEVFETPYDLVNLGAVSAHLKRKFPLRGHPQWRDKI